VQPHGRESAPAEFSQRELGCANGSSACHNNRAKLPKAQLILIVNLASYHLGVISALAIRETIWHLSIMSLTSAVAQQANSLPVA